MINVRQAQLKLSKIMFALWMIAGTAIGATAATASWDPNTEPDLAGYKLSYGTQPGVHTVIVDVGKTTTYQFNPPPGKTYYVVVQAYNAAGELSEKSAEATLYVPMPNQPPVLMQPANQTTAVNAAVSLALSAADPEGSTLRFTATGLPPGLSVNSASGVISGSASKTGSYQVTVTVSDGALSVSRTFGWVVAEGRASDTTNRPPTLTQPANQTSAIGAAVSLLLSANDPEGAKLTFTATGLPAGLSLNSTSGLISGAARNAGSSQVTVSVSDGSLSASRTFTWNVVAARNGGRSIASDEAADAVADPSLPQDHVGVSGDFDGDGRLDLGTYRPSSGEWRIWTSSANFATATDMVWGEPGDRPMAADYNGDRVTDLGVYRPSTGTWHLWLSGSRTPLNIEWGGRDDSAVAVDHDGDGKADLAVIRDGGYEILLSTANYLRSVQIR